MDACSVDDSRSFVHASNRLTQRAAPNLEPSLILHYIGIGSCPAKRATRPSMPEADPTSRLSRLDERLPLLQLPGALRPQSHTSAGRCCRFHTANSRAGGTVATLPPGLPRVRLTGGSSRRVKLRRPLFPGFR